jgi:hypothetical protein
VRLILLLSSTLDTSTVHRQSRGREGPSSPSLRLHFNLFRHLHTFCFRSELLRFCPPLFVLPEAHLLRPAFLHFNNRDLCNSLEMVYALTYRRPAHVPASSRGSVNGSEKTGSIHESITSGSSGSSHGVPDAISFDRIIDGGTCPVSGTLFSFEKLLMKKARYRSRLHGFLEIR